MRLQRHDCAGRRLNGCTLKNNLSQQLYPAQRMWFEVLHAGVFDWKPLPLEGEQVQTHNQRSGHGSR
ncbi:hypothetical protein L596_004698 [Steinernema carpocapsae]|uniref:Uncharacterized protein n=1 Tax=Steinernema carpocapsae TaxID=34508 RepID=A0A4U8UWL3_STECR|nr:hypothetical protein L596_004698 [Steinernema carpocapsae]